MLPSDKIIASQEIRILVHRALLIVTSSKIDQTNSPSIIEFCRGTHKVMSLESNYFGFLNNKDLVYMGVVHFCVQKQKVNQSILLFLINGW